MTYIYIFLIFFGCKNELEKNVATNASADTTGVLLDPTEQILINDSIIPINEAIVPSAGTMSTNVDPTGILDETDENIDSESKPAIKEMIEYAEDISVEGKVNGEPEDEDEEAEEPEILSDPPSHELLNKLLKQYVTKSGNVNYKGLKQNEASLDKYLNILEGAVFSKNWTSFEKLAFWINAYNAYTLKLILKNYPVSSIMQIDNGKTWDKRWIRLVGMNLSLNQIENEIIRPRYNEPRIHFAVNCAAKSCPPLLNEAWTPENLERNFEKQTKKFINNSDFNVISPNKIEVSQIFQWYAADFGNLIEFLNKYSTVSISPSAKIRYKQYDWTLNGQ